MASDSASHVNFPEIKIAQSRRARLIRDTRSENADAIRTAFNVTYGTFAAMAAGAFCKESTITTRAEAIVAKLAGDDFDYNRALGLKMKREAAGLLYTKEDAEADIVRIAAAERRKMDAVFSPGKEPCCVTDETRRYFAGLNNSAVNSYWEDLHDVYARQNRRETLEAFALPEVDKFEVFSTGIFRNRIRWNIKDAAAGIRALKSLIKALGREKKTSDGLYAATLQKYQITAALIKREAARGYSEVEIVAACIMSARYNRATDKYKIQVSQIKRLLKLFDKLR